MELVSQFANARALGSPAGALARSAADLVPAWDGDR